MLISPHKNNKTVNNYEPITIAQGKFWTIMKQQQKSHRAQKRRWPHGRVQAAFYLRPPILRSRAV